MHYKKFFAVSVEESSKPKMEKFQRGQFERLVKRKPGRAAGFRRFARGRTVPQSGKIPNSQQSKSQ
jgi:hypothetical protein